jgi:hypothetical protein
VVQNFSRIVVADEWTAAGAANVTWAMHFFASETAVVVSADGRTATLTGGGSTIVAAVETPPTARFEVVTPTILPPQNPVKELRKLVVVLDPKVNPTLQVSFAAPGTPPLAPSALNPLALWGSAGVAAVFI